MWRQARRTRLPLSHGVHRAVRREENSMGSCCSSTLTRLKLIQINQWKSGKEGRSLWRGRAESSTALRKRCGSCWRSRCCAGFSGGIQRFSTGGRGPGRAGHARNLRKGRMDTWTGLRQEVAEFERLLEALERRTELVNRITADQWQSRAEVRRVLALVPVPTTQGSDDERQEDA